MFLYQKSEEIYYYDINLRRCYFFKFFVMPLTWLYATKTTLTAPPPSFWTDLLSDLSLSSTESSPPSLEDDSAHESSLSAEEGKRCGEELRRCITRMLSTGNCRQRKKIPNLEDVFKNNQIKNLQWQYSNSSSNDNKNLAADVKFKLN